MIKPDVLVCWPQGHDYPLWRAQLARDRKLFGKILIALTDDPIDITSYLARVLRVAHFVDTTNHSDHWYDRALNAALDASMSSWVLFTEQDFLYGPGFLDEVWAAAPDYEMICAERGTRVPDPGFCLVRRDVVDLTNRDFSDRPGVLDNFDAFGEELRSIARWTTVQKLGVTGWRHLNGLSNNHSNLDRGDTVPYRPDEFASYLADCLLEPGLEPGWKKRVTDWLLCYTESEEVSLG